jgi:tryptophanyl-tRNA synthetase|tara:strand:+ start:3161 stop:3475 length:315 start_codon:yes stop_codon:yes gene_type:complete
MEEGEQMDEGQAERGQMEGGSFEEGQVREVGVKPEVSGLIETYSQGQRDVEQLRNQTMENFIQQLSDLVEEKDKLIKELRAELETNSNKVNEFKNRLGEIISNL